jgi:hypothetical protein
MMLALRIVNADRTAEQQRRTRSLIKGPKKKLRRASTTCTEFVDV